MSHWIWVMVAGVLVGWLAGLLVGGKGLGLLGNMVVGIAGAVLGRFLANWLHLPIHGFWEDLGTAVLGAVVFLLFLRMLKTS